MLRASTVREPWLGARVGLLVAAIFVCAATVARSEEPAARQHEVRWQVFDFPPYFITQGPQQGRGIYDEFLRALALDLPQFNHLTELTHPHRAEAQFKRGGETWCAVSRIQTAERDAYSVFTRRAFLQILPVQLAVSQVNVPKLAPHLQQGQVSLAGLLSSQSLKLGVVEDRRFGSPIDELIDQARQRPASPITTWPGTSLSADSLRLMASGRFDASLVYATELAGQPAQAAQHEVQLFPIAEAPTLVPARASCSATPLGRAVILAIDQLPKTARSLGAVQQRYMADLPAQAQSRYRALLAR